MPFLFWNLIEESKASGAEQIDFGRTDLDNDGLITFKDRFGAARKRLTYFRYPESAKEKSVMASYLPAARHLFSALPNAILPWAGRLVYRHIG
jgi:lipid II:glycine glycyltransferase (peptidoglycan interpeptide bridge formation enzyme)